MNFAEHIHILNKYVIGGTRRPFIKYIQLSTSGGERELGMVKKEEKL